MTIIELNTLAAGVMLTLAGTSGLIRHGLLEPSMPNYPKGPPWLLGVFFVFASFLIFIGLRYVTTFFIGVDQTPPGAAAVMVSMSFMLLIYKVSLLVNVLMQRYPSEVWDRINRITTIVKTSCPRR